MYIFIFFSLVFFLRCLLSKPLVFVIAYPQNYIAYFLIFWHIDDYRLFSSNN